MPQDKQIVAAIVETLEPLDVRTRAMFGAYGLYCDDKFMGIIGDDQLFIKPSDAEPALFAGVEMAKPYEEAKDYYLVAEPLDVDPEWLRDVVQATADALPLPKPKKRRTRPAT